MIGGRTVIMIGAAVVVGGLAVWGLLSPSADAPSGPLLQLPTPGALTAGPAVADAGNGPFREFCAECHGDEAVGTDKGPPLVHMYYEPNHHADASFVLAARRGAAQHHWTFGPMEPVARVSDSELYAIIGYVRSLQRAAGIF